MKTKSSFPAFLIASAIAAAFIDFYPIPTRADTIALTFTPSGTVLGPAAQASTQGWAFTLSDPVLVTQLGVWDPIGTGLGEPHTVTIWTSGGVAEAQGSVPSGAGPETNGFRYVSIAPVLLAPGSYTIGALYSAFSPDRSAILASTISTAPNVTYDGSRFATGDAFPPTDDFGARNSYFGPNFQFTSPVTNGVPETGSAWMFLLIALTAVIGLRFFASRAG